MAGKYIQLKEAMKTMRTYAPFSIAWVGADLKRKKAGRWFDLPNCVLSASSTAKKQGQSGAEKPEGIPRLANSIENDTINIMNLTNRDIFTVHIRLIKEFNQKELVY
jgi:hypothetical protein